MLAALAFLKSGGAIIGGIFGWLLGDWRRLAIALSLIALVATYVVGDYRGRHAGDATWQAKLDKQGRDFIAAADKAATAEHNRQTTAATAAQSAFDKQMRARDAADAAKDVELNKEIANAHKGQPKPDSKGNACDLTPDDLHALGVR